MEKSMYFEYAEKFFPQLVLSVVEKLNDSSRPLTYLYRDLLTRQFSADGKWASILAHYTQVAADVVALDSELPLKARCEGFRLLVHFLYANSTSENSKNVSLFRKDLR